MDEVSVIIADGQFRHKISITKALSAKIKTKVNEMEPKLIPLYVPILADWMSNK